MQKRERKGDDEMFVSSVCLTPIETFRPREIDSHAKLPSDRRCQTQFADRVGGDSNAWKRSRMNFGANSNV